MVNYANKNVSYSYICIIYMCSYICVIYCVKYLYILDILMLIFLFDWISSLPRSVPEAGKLVKGANYVRIKSALKTESKESMFDWILRHINPCELTNSIKKKKLKKNPHTFISLPHLHTSGWFFIWICYSGIPVLVNTICSPPLCLPIT